MTKFLVMEFITLSAAPLYHVDRTAQALVWLSNVPPPPNHVIDPLGGGPIRHKFFRDYTAGTSAFLKRRGTTTVHAQGACLRAFIFFRASAVR
jgi:hypothetical protein